MPYFQRQLFVALNNHVGREEFHSINLGIIADDIWVQQIKDGQSIIDEIQSTHLRDGY